jgi:FkbM family methyltransferase
MIKYTTLPSGKIIATIEGDTHISKWAIEAGRLDHDQNVLPLLKQYIPEGGVVIDGGAFIGDHTVFYAKCVGPIGNVYAYEPNELPFKCLMHNTDGMPVICFRAGLSNNHGTASSTYSPNAGASYLEPGDAVHLLTIDGMNLTRLDFLKLDIEGFELKALQGAIQTINRCRPVMLIEVNEEALNRQGSTGQQLMDMVVSLGYTIRNIHKGQPMTGPQFDILCTPQ